MKIQVHEIEGKHYCSIDDITVALSKSTGVSRTRERCLADLIQNYDIFLRYDLCVEYCYDTYCGDKEDRFLPIPSGFYQVSDWGYDCINESCEACGYFYNPLTDQECLPSIPRSQRNHFAPSKSDERPTIKIKCLSQLRNPTSFFDRISFPVADCCDSLFLQNISQSYVSLVDAQIQLSCFNDISFTVPATQEKETIKQSNKKPSTKTTNKQEDILAAIALLYIGSEKHTRPEPKELAKEIISDLNKKYSSLGIKEELVTLETLEKYITNGIERITE